jgi:predicted secreted protein
MQLYFTGNDYSGHAMSPRAAKLNPAILLLGATAVSGGAGYVVQLLVAGSLGPVDYAPFAFFWSALYLVVGTFGGLQQEVTRATSARPDPAGPRSARPSRVSTLTTVVAAIVFALLAGTSPLWGPALFGAGSTAVVWPLVIGATSYLFVAGLCGALYGVQWWYPLVALMALDGVLRLAATGLVLWLSPGLPALAWAVAIPFPLAIAIVLPFIAGRVKPVLDIGYPQLARNIARTLVAAAATACMISGFPALLAVSSPEAPLALLGSVTFALTLTRAPIVIPIMALQSYLIVRFTAAGDGLLRAVVRLEALVLAGSLVLAGLAAWLGPLVLSVVRDDFRVTPLLFFVIVASAGLIGAMSISGPAALARSAHTAYSAGWVAAALLTIAALFVPLSFEGRLSLALLVGPVVGVAVHLVGLRSRIARASS